MNHPHPTDLLFRTEWVSLLRSPDGYVYSHETRCQGRIVAVLPYAGDGPDRRYLLVREVTPCWSPTPVLSSITGGWEGDDVVADAARELYEEAGYMVAPGELFPLGTSYASKSADTVYHLFAADLTGRTQAARRPEQGIEPVWLSPWQLPSVCDPQVAVMEQRLRWFHDNGRVGA